MVRLRTTAALSGMILFCLVRAAAADDMITVGQLLTDCHANGNLCAQHFSDQSISMAFLWGGNCLPSKMTRQQAEISVLRWLASNQSLSQEDAPDGVADAVTALWPCGGD